MLTVGIYTTCLHCAWFTWDSVYKSYYVLQITAIRTITATLYNLTVTDSKNTKPVQWDLYNHCGSGPKQCFLRAECPAEKPCDKNNFQHWSMAREKISGDPTVTAPCPCC